MSAVMYEVDAVHDRILPREAAGHYEVLAFKDLREVTRIRRERLVIGAHVFEPGQEYERFGSTRKTSAGYIHYDGEPLTFIGTWRDYALFGRDGAGIPLEEHAIGFYAWKFCLETRIFIAVNASNAGRVMEMGELPTGKRKWNGKRST